MIQNLLVVREQREVQLFSFGMGNKGNSKGVRVREGKIEKTRF